MNNFNNIVYWKKRDDYKKQVEFSSSFSYSLEKKSKLLICNTY
jgi:hypothetical protein